MKLSSFITDNVRLRMGIESRPTFTEAVLYTIGLST